MGAGGEMPILSFSNQPLKDKDTDSLMHPNVSLFDFFVIWKKKNIRKHSSKMRTARFYNYTTTPGYPTPNPPPHTLQSRYPTLEATCDQRYPTPPHPHEQTDACENITFPQLLLRAVIKMTRQEMAEDLWV